MRTRPPLASGRAQCAAAAARWQRRAGSGRGCPLAAGTGTVRRAWLRRHVVAAPSPAASPFPSVTIPASRWVFATLPSPFSPLKAEMPSAPQRAGLLCFQGGCWPSRESPSCVRQVAASWRSCEDGVWCYPEGKEVCRNARRGPCTCKAGAREDVWHRQK